MVNFLIKILLYASTPKFMGSLRPLIYETEDEYIKNLIIFINSMSNRQDIHLAIRHRERENLNCNDLLKILLNQIIIKFILMENLKIIYSSLIY